MRSALNTIAQLVSSKEIKSLAALFECPFPIYSSSTFTFLPTRQRIEIEVDQFVSAIHSRGCAELLVKNYTVEDQTGNRCLVLVTWDLVLSDGSAFEQSTSRFVLHRQKTGQAPLIELMEVLASQFPKRCRPKLEIVSN